MAEVIITPWGLLLGAAFAASLGGTLVWMFRVPRQEELPPEEEIARVRINNILVPSLGTPFTRRLVEFACLLAKETRADVSAVYVIELPLTVPPDADLPEERAKAEKALSEAKEIAKGHGVELYTRVLKSRWAGKTIVELAVRDKSSLILLGAKRDSPEIFGRTVRYVIEHAPCEVLLEVPAKVTAA